MLPKADGLEVLQRIQQEDRTPIIVLTAKADHAQLVKVKYPKSYPAKAEAKGTVSAIDHQGNTFSLGSLSFYVDGYTVLKRDDPDGPIAFADIQVGDYMEVQYDPTRTDAGMRALRA